ncbi:photosystem II core complex proteins psbY, chloroplastic-like [Trifolium pratense]|uniref:photosystem II core complex proteins psbY, chloroplastic-like n=1 Tax=Trifolium pratense TaxID=57577 RepID=UPI001E696AA4|nr:photosystem II core complex proteins psbY, chloroplastic-like [Trifolium pratense]
MAATMAMMINSKCLNTSLPKLQNPTTKLTTTTCKITATQNQPKGLISIENTKFVSPSFAIAGAIFSSLATSDAAFAAQQIAEIAEGDNRGIALLLPLIPAIAWVLFNILQPALNQINRMRSTRGVIVGLGLGLGGLAASGMVSEASASEIGSIAEAAAAAGSDNRGTLLLFVVAPAILWVLYNILQPALNQINRMRN